MVLRQQFVIGRFMFQRRCAGLIFRLFIVSVGSQFEQGVDADTGQRQHRDLPQRVHGAEVDNDHVDHVSTMGQQQAVVGEVL